MTKIEKLTSISTEPLGPQPKASPDWFGVFSLGTELFSMLQEKNGFYAFESALHVFPLLPDHSNGLEAWNSASLWRNAYEDLSEGLLFFAEDILQDQFCLSKKQDGVYRFQAETGQVVLMAGSIGEWAERILDNYNVETGWPLLHEWQNKNGPLPPGKRLMPKTPFFLGGEYKLENLWAGDSLEGMRLKANLAMQTRHLPEGSKVRIDISPKTQ